jgi:hypothetical protein
MRVSFFHTLHCDIVASKCFISDLLEILDSFFDSWDGRGRKIGRYGNWVVAHDEVEWGSFAGGVDETIMDEFGHREVFVPG